MASRHSYFKTFVVVIGVASLALIITDNLLKLREASSRIKDAASLLKIRKGTRDTTNGSEGLHRFPAQLGEQLRGMPQRHQGGDRDVIGEADELLNG